MNVVKNECNYYKHIRLCCKRIKMHAIHVYQILWIHSIHVVKKKNSVLIDFHINNNIGEQR